MFSPRVGSTRPGTSPFTPTSKSGRSASKRVANVFTPQRKQKGQQNRSALQASQLIEETPNFRIEKYGMPLPVLITEVLTFADRSSKISVQIEDSGWAWLVGGRKLFVWRYKQASTGRNVLCKELTLPPSDLAHSADRVCVIPSSGDHQAAACIAVSPEGVVRYWSNIAYESSYMEVSAELKGEECACVVNLQPYGFLLATTTSSLVLLTTTPGQNNVAVKPIKAAQGMFAGFGRRMSSLIFGGGPGQATGATLQAVISGHYEEDERPFYLLSGAHFQKWLVDDYSPEKFLYQLDADRLFRQDLARQIWDKDAVQMPQLVTWILDMKLTRDGVMFLGAGLDMESEPLVHFAVATLVTNVSGTPSKLEAFKVLSFKRRYQEDMENEILSYKLLTPDRNREETYLYNTTHVVIDTGNGADSEELPLPGGCQLGAGVCENTAVFFSISQGLISIVSTQKPEMSILDDPTEERTHDLSSLSTNMTQIQELSMSEDKPSRLKAAFLAACAGNLKYAQEVVDELFPDSMVTSETQTTEIDRLVVGLSRNLIDDYPGSDPRWAENTKADGGGSSSLSLIILQQLEDKKRAHGYILNFLKKTNIWDKLRTVKTGDHVISTRLLLCQHAEKVEAAIVLRQMHAEYGDVINPAISKALNFRGEQWTQGLSPHDVFYRQIASSCGSSERFLSRDVSKVSEKKFLRTGFPIEALTVAKAHITLFNEIMGFSNSEVSLIHEIVEALLEYESNIMGGNFKPSEILMVIAAVNPVLEGMFYAALSYRHEKAQDYLSRAPLQPEPEYIPWTSTVGNSGIRSLILRQFMLTLETAVPEASDMETKGQLFKQLQGLADTVLDGYTSQLASLAQNPDMAEYMSQVEEKFHQDRRALISPFLEHKQFEKAGSLAEKYCDFEMLISICEATGNQERIQRYQQQFADRGFSDFLFTWYMKEGKRGKLMSLPIPQKSRLRDFLQQDELGYLKWLHDIEQKDFRSAHDTLLQLGRNEEQFLAKKKTLLSLSKLCALAYEGNDEEMQENIRNIDEEQELIINQELLPDKLLERLNIDPEHMRVLTPVELIQLYICDENSSATEHDFKKALDLLQFLDKDDSNVDYDEVRTSVWCKSILRDRAVWVHPTTGDPLDIVKDTIFFKTISLAVTEGWDPSSCLPSLQEMLSCEVLSPISNDKQLQFLLGAVYELANSVIQ